MILIAILLGLVQGLGEFLPISSSGHLLFLQQAFGLENPLFFSVLLHIATLLAVCLLMWKDIWRMICHPFSKETLCVLVTSVVSAVIYFGCKRIFDEALDNPKWLGYCFIITTAMLFAVDEYLKRHPQREMRSIEEVTWKDAVIIGLFQAFAIFPGISRAGATISGSMISGLERTSSARYAFISSIPVVGGSLLLEILDVIEDPSSVADMNWFAIALGMLTAFVVGVFAIKFMMKLLKKTSLWVFGVYTFVLGLFILFDQWFFHLIAW